MNAISTANIELYGRLEGTGTPLTLSKRDAIDTDRLLSLYKPHTNLGIRDEVETNQGKKTYKLIKN